MCIAHSVENLLGVEQVLDLFRLEIKLHRIAFVWTLFTNICRDDLVITMAMKSEALLSTHYSFEQ